MATLLELRLKLADETEAFQVMLEGHRLDPDNAQLYEDMLKAMAAMETAYAELAFAR